MDASKDVAHKSPIVSFHYGVSPKSQTVTLNRNAHFFCNSKGPVKWTFEGGDLPINTLTSMWKQSSLGYCLTLTNVSMNNAGQYFCHGSVSKGNYFDSEGTLIVKCKFFC